MVVVGVSDETESKLQSYVEEKEPKYPIIRAPGAMDKYGGKFYPSFFTIGADGRILTVPDDRLPDEQFIKQALGSVILLSDLPKDPRYNPLRSAYKNRKYKAVADYFDKMLARDLDEQTLGFVKEQKAKFERRLERTSAQVEELSKGPDYFAAEARLRRIAKEWKGLAAADQAREALARFKTDAKVKQEITASRALQKLLKRFDPSKKSHRRKMRTALSRFIKKYSDTHAGNQASKKLAALNQG